MTKRIKERVGGRWWRMLELTGRTVVAGGFVFLVYSLDAGIRHEDGAAGYGLMVLSAVAALFCGTLLMVLARTSDTRWLCSRCKKELRVKHLKACVNCMVELE